MLVRPIADLPQITAGDLTLLREVLSPASDDVELRYSMAHARLPAGASSTPHRLAGSEVYVFLAGRGAITVDGETRRIGAGDVVYVPPRALQHVDSDGAEELVFLCIVDPPWRAEDEEVLGEAR